MLLKEKINKLKSSSNELVNMIFEPVFFRLNQPIDKEKLQELLDKKPTVCLLDEIQSQLQELVKLRHPAMKFTQVELEEEVKIHVGTQPIEEYGVWVYYPWRNMVVHLLDETEFVEVRTNRNQYKITPEEEEILATKKIGIIGLSVGKSIALTMAMERICGELVLADFDVIELSNLNRIQTGVHHFNIKKTVVAAREIAEIDPYLKVTCYHEGITEANIDDFFTKDKKLDVCVEVCDGLEIKILARQKAKALGIPVVMTTSDRGMTDIERFDKENNRAIFHGLINDVNIEDIKSLNTNKDKVSIVETIIGKETMSDELKMSMLEISKTITTWPQLGSCVAMGGAILCSVCRRLLLNKKSIISGRFFVDIEKIVYHI